MRKNTKWSRQTLGLMLICLVLQTVRWIFPGLAHTVPFRIIYDSLINLILILTAWTVGLRGGLVLSAFVALLSYLTGGMLLIRVAPLVAMGHGLLVLTVWALQKFKPYGVVVGAAIKFVFLYYMVGMWRLPVLAAKGLMTDAAAGAIVADMGILQFAAALIGGMAAMLIAWRWRRGGREGKV